MRTYVPSGYGLLEFVFTLSGVTRRMTSTLGLSFVGTPVQLTCDNLISYFYQVWSPRLPSAYTYRGGRLYVGNNTHTPPYFEKVFALPGTNTNALLLPANVTHVVNKNTALGGRKGKGRMYLPGCKEGDPDNQGIIPAATLAVYNTSLASLKTAIEGHAQVGNLYLLGHSSAWGPVQITSLTMRAKVGTQVNRVRKA